MPSLLKRSLLFILLLYKQRRTIWLMALRDRSNSIMNSYFGFLWSFLQPVVTILVLWFVFWFGLKASGNVSGVPFVLWLTIGIIPWSFIIDSLNNGTEAITSYDYLVKKVVFNVETLPAIKVLSSLLTHTFFLIFLFVLSFIYGRISFYAIQTFYYLFCGIIYVFGWTLITSSINVFFRDTSKILNILNHIGFWLTPIFWNAALIPEKYKWIIKLNPVFYIVNGYRDSLLHNIGFWQRPVWTIGFWFATLLILWLGLLVFAKTKPYFADAL